MNTRIQMQACFWIIFKVTETVLFLDPFLEDQAFETSGKK